MFQAEGLTRLFERFWKTRKKMYISSSALERAERTEVQWKSED